MNHIHDIGDPSCRAVFEMLSEYMDGELPAATCEEMEAHIAGCEPCVRFLDSLRKSVALSRCFQQEMTPPAIPDAVREALLAAYEGSMRKRLA